MKKERILYFDILKLLACFSVITIHIISEFWYTMDIGSLGFKISTSFLTLISCSVPIFIMISGALFLNEKKRITIKYMYTKYIGKLFLILFFWNMFYNILTYKFLNHTDITLTLIINILKDTIIGKEIYHLWFLPIIIGLYVCTPVIKILAKKENKVIIEYLLFILLLSTGLYIPLRNFFGISDFYQLAFTGYLFYFLGGYYFNTFELSEKIKKLIYFSGIIAFSFSLLFIFKDAQNIGYKSQLIFTYLNINMMIISVSIFLFFKNINFKFNPYFKKILTNISDNFLGIYIIHALIIAFFIYTKFFNFTSNYLFIVLLYPIITFVFSFLTILIMKKIPIIKKLIS